MHRHPPSAGGLPIADLAEIYSVSRATVYRVLERARDNV
ncbi:helix-turn-helix domain-containing protein [Streptomyces sp. NPDC006012]